MKGVRRRVHGAGVRVKGRRGVTVPESAISGLKFLGSGSARERGGQDSEDALRGSVLRVSRV